MEVNSSHVLPEYSPVYPISFSRQPDKGDIKKQDWNLDKQTS